jgi:ferritin
MTIGKKIQNAFNKQINAETYSSYMYWSMSAYFESLNLRGFANWMRAQAQEEMLHAAKFYDFVVDRGGRVLLSAIEAPPTEWSSPQAAFEAVLEHEQKVTGLIHGLVELAAEEKDHASGGFLQWFVNEQVEEEANAAEIVQKLRMLSKAPGERGPQTPHGVALYMFDRELATRKFSPKGD